MLRALSGHSLWVTFDAKLVPWDLLGQQEKSDSAAGRQSKRPLRKRPGRGNATSNTEALDPGLRRDDQQNHQGARATGPCNTANTLFATRPTGPNLSVIIPINRKSSSLQ